MSGGQCPGVQGLTEKAAGGRIPSGRLESRCLLLVTADARLLSVKVRLALVALSWYGFTLPHSLPAVL